GGRMVGRIGGWVGRGAGCVFQQCLNLDLQSGAFGALIGSSEPFLHIRSVARPCPSRLLRLSRLASALKPKGWLNTVASSYTTKLSFDSIMMHSINGVRL